VACNKLQITVNVPCNEMYEIMDCLAKACFPYHRTINLNTDICRKGTVGKPVLIRRDIMETRLKRPDATNLDLGVMVLRWRWHSAGWG